MNTNTNIEIIIRINKALASNTLTRAQRREFIARRTALVKAHDRRRRRVRSIARTRFN